MITPQQKLIPLFTRELGDDFIQSPLPPGEGQGEGKCQGEGPITVGEFLGQAQLM
jgi:hypothetical protein